MARALVVPTAQAWTGDIVFQWTLVDVFLQNTLAPSPSHHRVAHPSSLTESIHSLISLSYTSLYIPAIQQQTNKFVPSNPPSLTMSVPSLLLASLRLVHASSTPSADRHAASQVLEDFKARQDALLAGLELYRSAPSSFVFSFIHSFFRLPLLFSRLTLVGLCRSLLFKRRKANSRAMIGEALYRSAHFRIPFDISYFVENHLHSSPFFD